MNSNSCPNCHTKAQSANGVLFQETRLLNASYLIITFNSATPFRIHRLAKRKRFMQYETLLNRLQISTRHTFRLWFLLILKTNHIFKRNKVLLWSFMIIWLKAQSVTQNMNTIILCPWYEIKVSDKNCSVSCYYIIVEWEMWMNLP